MHELVVIDEDGQNRALLDAYETVTLTEKFYTGSTVQVVMNQYAGGVEEVQKGRFLTILGHGHHADEEIFLIEQIETELTDEGVVTGNLIVSGFAVGHLEDRLVIPPPDASHQVHDDVPAETAIKSLVSDNSGPTAIAARQLPRFVIAADEGRGAQVHVKSRFDNLAALVERIGMFAGMGWRTTFDHTNNQYVFQVIVGVDRTDEVFFTIDFESITGQRILTSDMGKKTFALVAGQGEGVERQIVETTLPGPAPEGFNRREAFIDARDVPDEAGSENTLAQRGQETLLAMQPGDSFEVDANVVGSFRFREHWNLGDLVTVRNESTRETKAVRIIQVQRERNADGEFVSVALDHAWPTLKDRVRETAGVAGSREGTVDYPSGGSGGAGVSGTLIGHAFTPHHFDWSGGGEATVLNVTVPSDGSRIFKITIDANSIMRSAIGNFSLRVYRDGVRIGNSFQRVFTADTEEAFVPIISLDTPPAGSVTYSFRAASGHDNNRITAGTGWPIRLIVEDITREVWGDAAAGFEVGPWITATLLNGWAHGAADRNLQYRKAFGRLELRGFLNPASATGTVAFVLPSEYRPSSVRYALVHQNTPGSPFPISRCSISTNGNVQVEFPSVHGTSGAVTGFDSITIPLD